MCGAATSPFLPLHPSKHAFVGVLAGPKKQVKPQQKANKFIAKIGERVETPCGAGRVLFCGKTEFADGDWVGVELDEAGEQSVAFFAICTCITPCTSNYLLSIPVGGKHDGEVAGKRYFSTDAGCGLFVRAASLQA